MKWLDARIINVSQEDEYMRWVPGLTVKNLAHELRELAEAIVKTLQGRGIPADEAARQRIHDEPDPKVLEAWRKRAITIARVEELFSGRR